MNAPQQHSITSPKGQYNYLLFDSVLAFNRFVDIEIRQLSKANQLCWDKVLHTTENNIKKGSDWYGTPTPKHTEALENHHRFLDMLLTQKIQPKIKEKLAQYLDYLNSSVLPKPQIGYNDRGLGVFSFDRAAMGLFEQYPLNTATPLSTTVSQMHIELGHKHIHTSVKQVYAYFKDKAQSYPSLQLYIMAGANAQVKGDNLLYVGLACVELVAFMEQRGVPVEVNVLIGTSFHDQVAMGVIRVKRFQDPLDKNQLLLLSSDPRYFRYRGFKGLIAMSNYFDLTIPMGLGTITALMGTAFVKAVNPKGFVFEQSYAMDSAVKEVSQIITDYKTQRDAKT